MIKEKDGDLGQILELYDGQTAKLNGTLLADNVPDLKYTARGKELYALSESLYCKWLKGGCSYALAERAIALCRDAVAEGYPHAVVKMGFYYDKDYVATDRAEEFRCRLACDYYCKVVYCDAPPKTEDNVVPEISWEELQRAAARMLLDMLSRAPSAFASYGSEKYSYAKNRERIKERFQIAVDENDGSERAERDREKFAVTVFDSCKRNKERAPLFGIIGLNADEVKRTFAPKSASMKLCGDVNIWLYNGERVVRVNTTTAFSQYLEDITAEEVWVYFFNNNLGGHRYLNGKQRKDLCELMMRDSFYRFSSLVASAKERERSEYLFSDDDVQFFMAGRLTSLKSALDGLIDKVINDTEWKSL